MFSGCLQSSSRLLLRDAKQRAYGQCTLARRSPLSIFPAVAAGIPDFPWGSIALALTMVGR